MIPSLWPRWLMQTARNFNDLESILVPTGIEQVDLDHRNLISQAFEINHTIEDLDNDSISLSLIFQIKEIYSRLRESTVELFRKEELLMKQYHLSGKREHIKRHHEILHTFDEMIRELDSGKLSTTLHPRTTIMKILLDHFNKDNAQLFNIKSYQKTFRIVRDAETISNLFPSTYIPIVDQTNMEIITILVDKEWVTDQNIKQNLLKKIKSLFKYEESTLQKYHSEKLDLHKQDHQQLILELENETLNEDNSPLEISSSFLMKWSLHHHHYNLKDLSLKSWGLDLFKKAHSSKSIQLHHEFNDPEIQMSQNLAFKLFLKIYRQYISLERNETNKELKNSILKGIKKFRSHLKYHNEIIEDEISDKENLNSIKSIHCNIISLLDYFTSLINSSHYALASYNRNNFIVNWLSSILYHELRILGQESTGNSP